MSGDVKNIKNTQLDKFINDPTASHCYKYSQAQRGQSDKKMENPQKNI
jgi:hypothetical protein